MNRLIVVTISAILSAPVGVLMASGRVMAGLVWLASAAVLYLLLGWYYCSETAAYRAAWRRQRRAEADTLRRSDLTDSEQRTV